MNKTTYLMGYMQKSAEDLTEMFGDIAEPSTSYIKVNKDPQKLPPVSLERYTPPTQKLLNLIKEHPNLSTILAATAAGGIAGGMLGGKDLKAVAVPRKSNVLKGALLSGGIAGGALAYKNRDKIRDFLKDTFGK